LVRPASDDLLFNHSRRAALRGMLHDHRDGLQPDPELLYVAAMFHDLGLIAKYRRADQRFELEGADAARTFLLDHGTRTTKPVTSGWPLRCTPRRKYPTSNQIAQVIATHPRAGFTDGILRAFHDRMKDRPETTFGMMNVDILAYFEPALTRTKLVDLINHNEPPQ
jgi:hypothetical protein